MACVCILFTLKSFSEQCEVVGPAEPVFAVAGEDAILPCSVKPSISVVDMRVEWFRLDLKDSQPVHLYEDHDDRNTDQIQSYRGRTKLIHQELQRGDASLKLSSVRVSDEGLYKCFIQSRSWHDDATVNVRNVLLMGLIFQGWYPEPDLEWLDGDGVSLIPETRETQKHGQIQCETQHHCTSQRQPDSLQSQSETSHAGACFSIFPTVNVILDGDTAHPRLIVSDDGKQVREGRTRREAVDGKTDRFNEYRGVLGKDGFSSGCFYFEVQVRGETKWYLGVARESVIRKGWIRLSSVNGCWTVSLYNGKYRARESSYVLLSLSVDPQRVGVFVDYNEGLVSFYDVESMSHIYSFTNQSFNEKLYPFVCLGYYWNKNSTPLIICDDYK
uniref:B30.2/SPRY domain-containing protein n=1 Tax=Sinocyclocheilus grahami TaxID=75366 RepID=A0A672N335_SINGR